MIRRGIYIEHHSLHLIANIMEVSYRLVVGLEYIKEQND